MAVMGVTQQSITFGGISSATYDLYIGGEGVWNAPARAVEVVSVPGRNGAIAIDQGHYENITVTYTVINQKSTLSDFLTKIDGFRNAICSQKGYQRLSDTFHPNEYRMAMFVDGMEVKPINYTTASEFEIKFNCKPQRFLTSGETETSVANNGTVTNPTKYDASPLLQVWGYGTVTVGDYDIEIANATMGDVTLLKYKSKKFTNVYKTDSSSYTLPLGAGPISENGDTITATVRMVCSVGAAVISQILSTSSVTTQPSYGTATVEGDLGNSHRVMLRINNATLTFTKGTSSSTTLTAVYSVDYKKAGGTTTRTATITVNLVVSYNATNDTIDLTTNYSYTAHDANDFWLSDRLLEVSSASVASTQSLLGTPTYIDCDLGTCYKIVSGTVVDLNGYIDLGSDLPVLKSGANTITYDNTVTQLKIVPRWWQL